MRPPTDKALVLRNLREYRHKWHSAKNRFLWLHFCRRKYQYLQQLLRNEPRMLPNSVK